MDGRIEFYNKIYSDRPDKWDLVWRDALALYVLSKHTQEPGTFLDIGCGNGHTIEFFNKRWPDTNYFGIDLSDEAIKIAKGRVPDAFFACDTFEDFVSFPPKDVVVLMGVAEHFEDLVPSLRRLKQFGKLFYLEVPDCITAGLLRGDTNKEEGFRETYRGSGQMEWHLKQKTWEQNFYFADLEIVQFYPGPECNYLWVLK